jgi:hypothetical protein
MSRSQLTLVDAADKHGPYAGVGEAEAILRTVGRRSKPGTQVGRDAAISAPLFRTMPGYATRSARLEWDSVET